ncbi:hypothetical protein Tco_1400161 [Tanacetum coccineum]
MDIFSYVHFDHVIWQERNCRLFKNQKRSQVQIIEVIKSIVRLKLLTCKFKSTLVEEDILADNLAKEDILVTGSLMEEDILAGILVADTLWVFMRRVPCWWITLEEDFRLVEDILLVKEGPLSEDILLVSEAPWL